MLSAEVHGPRLYHGCPSAPDISDLGEQAAFWNRVFCRFNGVVDWIGIHFDDDDPSSIPKLRLHETIVVLVLGSALAGRMRSQIS
jgi:hypothetical protein